MYTYIFVQIRIQINSILQLVRCFQYAWQCFCGHSITQGKRANENTCKSPCKGDKSETCGGTWRLSVYSTGSDCYWRRPITLLL